MDSYKRQAFSRVFDSRSTMSRDETWRRRRNKKSKSVVAPEDIVRPKNIRVKIPISVKTASYVPGPVTLENNKPQRSENIRQ